MGALYTEIVGGGGSINDGALKRLRCLDVQIAWKGEAEDYLQKDSQTDSSLVLKIQALCCKDEDSFFLRHSGSEIKSERVGS